MILASAIQEPSMQNADQLATELRRVVSRETVFRQNEPMAKRTTLRVGGPADFYIEPVSEAELGAVLQVCTAANVPIFLLGRGSNLLVRDGGFRGVVICLAHPNFSQIEINGTRLTCGAGAKLKLVAMEARRQGLSGLEFLEGIPGSIGGALRMNAGAMGSATFDLVESVRLMDRSGMIQDIAAHALQVEYRCCVYLKNHVALGAVLRGTPAPIEQIEERMKGFNQKRWTSQPAASSAGCIFKNPASIPAGKLIDDLGMKGSRIGGAAVSPEHGNFIVNVASATALEVLELIAIIKARARDERGIELHTEVEIIGEDKG